MMRRSTRLLILALIIVEISAAVASNYPQRLKRQQNFGGSPCGGSYPLGNYGYNVGGMGGCGSYGYGNGLGSYFYGQYGGGYNNNYGGTNIGSINTENISG
ncbi:unnamed protein product [Toxocara canis]|uniref:Uncharacterized protein n=1 Tax=Toxocara canis TaxID=6265 RepID=A0A183UU28_TOXCA|nr:unnamed protein product [Toxocara canis]